MFSQEYTYWQLISCLPYPACNNHGGEAKWARETDGGTWQMLQVHLRVQLVVAAQQADVQQLVFTAGDWL